MYCPEKHSCGKCPKKDFVENAVLMYSEYLRMIENLDEEEY
jgi:hypothetical protein